MSSHERSDAEPLDLERDVPTTADDIAALRRGARTTLSWLSLPYAQLSALIPRGAIERRPPIRDDAKPFTLP
jgi:hypothetical protein